MQTTTALTTRAFVQMQALKARLADERGDIGGNIVWTAGIILAAIAIIGILYLKLVAGAEAIDVSPGV